MTLFFMCLASIGSPPFSLSTSQVSCNMSMGESTTMCAGAFELSGMWTKGTGNHVVIGPVGPFVVTSLNVTKEVASSSPSTIIFLYFPLFLFFEGNGWLVALWMFIGYGRNEEHAMTTHLI